MIPFFTLQYLFLKKQCKNNAAVLKHCLEVNPSEVKYLFLKAQMS